MTLLARLRALAVAASFAALPSCALGNRLVASPAEYGSYRETRTAWTPEDRLVAAMSYLREYPHGRFAAEVRSRFEIDEQGFYDRQSTSIPGLEWYLHVLPDGPHASAASLYLAELEARSRAQGMDALVVSARATERRLAARARGRKAVTETFVAFLGAFASENSFGRPTWELPGEALELLRGVPSPGRCDDRACRRVITIPFEIPVAGGGVEERAMVMELEVSLREGRVRQAEVRGPELFSRLWEADRGQPMEHDREIARATAVGYALDVVGGAVEAITPQGRCDRPIVPPTAILRECDGWRVEARVGGLPSEDDVVTLRGPVR
jgi:hypothetical protein